MTSWGLLPNWFLLKPPCLIHLIWFCMPCSIACIIFAVIITLPPGNRNAMITVCVYSHVSGLPSCLSVSHANLKTLWSESWLQNKCQRHDPSITLLKTNDPAEVRDLMWGESCLMTPHHTVWEAAHSKAPQEVPQLWKQPQRVTAQSQAWDTDLEKIRLCLFQRSWNNLSFNCYSPQAAALTWKLFLWHIGLLGTSWTSREDWAFQ